jgi:hypothetical protein
MCLKFEALVGTLTGTVSGKRGEWAVTTTAPGGVVTADETTARTWFPLFSEMLATDFENANRRRFSERHREAIR